MTMSVVACGRVMGEPVVVGTERGSMAVFVLTTADESAPDQVAGNRAACEVLCRERLEGAVLNRLSDGDQVLVVGEQHLMRLLGPAEDDLTCATVQIEASAIGINIDLSPIST
jgi:hypothetical protein